VVRAPVPAPSAHLQYRRRQVPAAF
jgi:hypothetical protein